MSWRCWNTIIIICSHPVFPNRLHTKQRTEKMLSPETGWISWLHFKKCQAPAALISVGNAGALRIRSGCQVFFCYWLAFLFSLQTGHSPMAFLCNNNRDLRPFSANFIYGLRQGHSASWARHKLCALCLWSERQGSGLSTFLLTYFSQFISHRNQGVGGCVCLFLAPAWSWDLPGWKSVLRSKGLLQVFCHDLTENSSMWYEVWVQCWSARLCS